MISQTDPQEHHYNKVEVTENRYCDYLKDLRDDKKTKAAIENKIQWQSEQAEEKQSAKEIRNKYPIS